MHIASIGIDLGKTTGVDIARPQVANEGYVEGD